MRPRPVRHHTASRRAEDCPTAWFAVLEHARAAADFAGAAHARRRLMRLGVRVSYVRVRRPTGVTRG